MRVRHMDIAFGDVVYHPAWVALEHGLNPDVEEVVKYNHEAKVRSCPHGNREKIPDDDDRVGYWRCRDCTSRVGAPSAAEGTFRLSGLLWRAHAAEVSSEK